MSLAMKALDQCVPEQSVAFVSPDLFSEFEKLFRSYVARRAFTLYEEAGRPKGRDWQHWLQAESEYLFARPKVLESRDRISLFAIVPEKPSRNIEICMAPLGVIIKTKLLRFDVQCLCPVKGSERPEQFLLACWTKKVDPGSADVTLDGSLLRLTAWKVTSLPPQAPVRPGTKQLPASRKYVQGPRASDRRPACNPQPSGRDAEPFSPSQ